MNNQIKIKKFDLPPEQIFEVRHYRVAVFMENPEDEAIVRIRESYNLQRGGEVKPESITREVEGVERELTEQEKEQILQAYEEKVGVNLTNREQ